MILYKVNQLPLGTRVRIVGIPAHSPWEFLPSIIGMEGIIAANSIDFLEGKFFRS